MKEPNTNHVVDKNKPSVGAVPEVRNLEQAIAEVLTMDPGSAGRATLPLVSYTGLKVLVVGIRKGTAWNEHSTPGRVSVQTLRGHIRMTALGRSYELPVGHMIALDSHVKHDVHGVEDSAFLLTVARPE